MTGSPVRDRNTHINEDTGKCRSMAMVMLFLRQTTGKTERYTHFCMSLKPVFTRDCGNGVHFMDEPINGLDPMGIIEIRKLLLKLNQEKNVTILISSHILTELENVATDYGFLNKGELVEEVAAEKLKEKCRTFLEVKVTDAAAYAALLETELLCSNYKVLPGNCIHILEHVDRVSDYSALAVKHDIGLLAFEMKEINLENYYMNLIGAENQTSDAQE